MQISIVGFLRNALDAIPEGNRNRAAHARTLTNLEHHLRTLLSSRREGEKAIDAFFANPSTDPRGIRWIADSVASRPTKRCGHPKMYGFALGELERHLTELQLRKAEGTKVLDEFFHVYVFEGA